MSKPRKGDITYYCPKCGGVLDSAHSPEACQFMAAQQEQLRIRREVYIQTIHVVIEVDAEERETRVTAFTDLTLARECLIKAAERIGCEVDRDDVMDGDVTGYTEDQSTVELVEGKLDTRLAHPVREYGAQEEHPLHTRESWRYESASGTTRLSYSDWVAQESISKGEGK